MKLQVLLGALGVMALATATPSAPAHALVIEANGTGSLVVTPIAPTVLRETITVSFTTTSGFTLDAGVLSVSIDLTAPDLATALFDSDFALTSSSGNGLFGTYGLTSSVFSSLTNETFTGVFQATSGIGEYAGYFGAGTFFGTNTYDDATLASGVTTIAVSGVLNVPEPATLTLLAFGVGMLTVGRVRRRAA